MTQRIIRQRTNAQLASVFRVVGCLQTLVCLFIYKTTDRDC